MKEFASGLWLSGNADSCLGNGLDCALRWLSEKTRRVKQKTLLKHKPAHGNRECTSPSWPTTAHGPVLSSLSPWITP